MYLKKTYRKQSGRTYLVIAQKYRNPKDVYKRQRLEEQRAFINLVVSRKKKAAEKEKDEAAGRQLQERILQLLSLIHICIPLKGRVLLMKSNDIFGNNVDKYEEWFKKNNFILDSEIRAIKGLLPAFEKGIEIGVGSGTVSYTHLDVYKRQRLEQIDRGERDFYF